MRLLLLLVAALAIIGGGGSQLLGSAKTGADTTIDALRTTQNPLAAGEAKTTGCARPELGTVKLSRSKYPNIVGHIKESWREGYAKVRRINRIGTSTRRDKLLQGIPTRPGFDRDEAPAAVLRSQVRASVRYVPSGENRSAGSTLGHQLGRYCDGVRVRYVFTP